MSFFVKRSRYFDLRSERGKYFLITTLTLTIFLTQLTLGTTARADTLTYNNPSFNTTWQRVDKAVQDGVAGVNRGFTWGNQVSGSQTVTSEPYNGPNRQVQYFDKARMEVNNPGGDPASLYYVTTGLLVKELVTGQRQDGDNTFTTLSPSTVQVAGDSNVNGVNAIAPTYASFRKLGTFSGAPSPVAANSPIVNSLDKSGNVTQINPLETRLTTGYDAVTGHNIADVFVNYANQNGIIWNGSAYTQGPLFFGNPTYVFGRPLTEPYWTLAVVKGVEQNVLVQLFERRVLTYTPANPEPYKVEMGNVGQHYFKWRYIDNGNNPPAATPPVSTPVNNPPVVNTQGLQNLNVTPIKDFAGQPFQFTGSGFSSKEQIKLWTTDPQNVVQSLIGTTTDAQGNFTYTYNSRGPLSGNWAITAYGVTSGKEAIGHFTLVDFVADSGKGATIVLSRIHGTINDRIDIHGSNFLPNELYSYWLTAPDGSVYAGIQSPSMKKASASGEVNIHGYQLPAAKPGKWAITIYGQFSKRIAVAYFSYDS